MGLLSCRGCSAKDKEIAHLMVQLDRLSGMVEKLQSRLGEIAEPGLEMRVARSGIQKAPTEAPKPLPRKPSFPGYAPEPVRLPIEIDDSIEES